MRVGLLVSIDRRLTELKTDAVRRCRWYWAQTRNTDVTRHTHLYWHTRHRIISSPVQRLYCCALYTEYAPGWASISPSHCTKCSTTDYQSSCYAVLTL